MSEYWIKDAELVNADVDQDAPGHATHVFVYLLNEISDSLISSGVKEAIEIGNTILESIVDDVVDVISLRSDLSNTFDFDIYEYISSFTEYDRDVVLMAFDGGKIDPILWACKNLGWIRVVYDYVESWGLRPSTMKRAAWALYEIDEDPSHVWHWENRQNGKILNLTTKQIENGMISESVVDLIAAMITYDPDIII